MTDLGLLDKLPMLQFPKDDSSTVIFDQTARVLDEESGGNLELFRQELDTI